MILQSKKTSIVFNLQESRSSGVGASFRARPPMSKPIHGRAVRLRPMGYAVTGWKLRTEN